MSPWPARDAELRRLRDADVPTIQIARTMKLTKSSVVNRAHRLFLKPRLSPIVKRASDEPLPHGRHGGAPMPAGHEISCQAIGIQPWYRPDA